MGKSALQGSGNFTNYATKNQNFSPKQSQLGTSQGHFAHSLTALEAYERCLMIYQSQTMQQLVHQINIFKRLQTNKFQYTQMKTS